LEALRFPNINLVIREKSGSLIRCPFPQKCVQRGIGKRIIPRWQKTNNAVYC
jgi:hypothetical protein